MSSLKSWNASLEVYSASCNISQPMTWMVMGGHYRSFDMQLERVRDVATRSSPCMFVLLFVRAHRIEGSIGHGRKIKIPFERLTHDKLKKAMRSIPNAGAAITGSSADIPRSWANIDTWIGGTLALDAVSYRIGRRQAHALDMIVFSRPDVIPSRPIDLTGFGSVPFAVYFSHSKSASGTYLDPTELFWIVSYRLWNKIMTGCAPSVVDGHGLKMCQLKTCKDTRANRKSKVLDIIAEAPEHFGGKNFYASHRLGIRILRYNKFRSEFFFLNGKPVDDPTVFNVAHDVLPFYSRCKAGHSDLPLQKSMIWQRLENNRVDASTRRLSRPLSSRSESE